MAVTATVFENREPPVCRLHVPEYTLNTILPYGDPSCHDSVMLALSLTGVPTVTVEGVLRVVPLKVPVQALTTNPPVDARARDAKYKE